MAGEAVSSTVFIRAMMFSFTPYDERGLGYAYNAACRIVPNPDDLIILMDGDVMMLPGTWGSLVQKAVSVHSYYDAYVCMATRTWEKGSQQVRDPVGVREMTDLRQLGQIAMDRAASHGAVVVPWPDDRSPSGFFMALRKRLWQDFPFPLVGIQGKPRIGIETAWFRTIRQAGRKVGLMTGLTAVHYYRFDRASDKDIGYLK